MDIVIISISDHLLQFVEAQMDHVSRLARKSALRDLLRSYLAQRRISAVLEEWSRPETTIARKLARENEPRILWKNIDMDEDERREAGIAEEQTSRGQSLVWGDGPLPELVLERVPGDSVREHHFVERVLEFKDGDGTLLVLIGKEHVHFVAENLRAVGQLVDIVAV